MVVLLFQIFPYISEQFEFLLYDVPEPSYGTFVFLWKMVIFHKKQKNSKMVKSGLNVMKSKNKHHFIYIITPLLYK